MKKNSLSLISFLIVITLKSQNYKELLHKDTIQIGTAMHSFCHTRGISKHPTFTLYTNLTLSQKRLLLNITYNDWLIILNNRNLVHGGIAALYDLRAKQSTFGNFRLFTKYFSGSKLEKEVKYWKNYLKNNKLEFVILD